MAYIEQGREAADPHGTSWCSELLARSYKFFNALYIPHKLKWRLYAEGQIINYYHGGSTGKLSIGFSRLIQCCAQRWNVIFNSIKLLRVRSKRQQLHASLLPLISNLKITYLEIFVRATAIRSKLRDADEKLRVNNFDYESVSPWNMNPRICSYSLRLAVSSLAHHGDWTPRFGLGFLIILQMLRFLVTGVPYVGVLKCRDSFGQLQLLVRCWGWSWC